MRVRDALEVMEVMVEFRTGRAVLVIPEDVLVGTVVVGRVRERRSDLCLGLV